MKRSNTHQNLKMKRIKLDTVMNESDRLKSAFVGACEAGDEKIVEMLLPWVKSNDVKQVNCSDTMGVTGLMAALMMDQYEVGGLLLDLPGIDTSARDKEGRTVLDYLLKSKSLFYLEEIVDDLEWSVPKDEINESILKKLQECLPELKSKITLFNRLLPFYSITYKCGELLNNALKYAGDGTTLAVKTILEEDVLKLYPNNLRALVAATAAGHTGLIRVLLPWNKLLNMGKFLRLCREKGVKDDIINQELYQALCYMMEEFKVKDLKAFNLGLKHLDINYQDQNGDTILMQVVKNITTSDFSFSSVGLKVLEKILKSDELDINLMNANGQSSLDFLHFDYPYYQTQETFLHLSPVMNRNSSNKVIPDKIIKTLPLDVQVLNKYKIRQDTFKDIDFNFVKNSLLIQAMNHCRLDLARFLIINCNVKILNCDLEEWKEFVRCIEVPVDQWCEVRKMLTDILEKIVHEDLLLVGSKPSH